VWSFIHPSEPNPNPGGGGGGGVYMFGGRSLETDEEAPTNVIMRWGGVAGEAWGVLPATGTPPRKAWGAAMAVHPSQPRLFIFGGTNLKSAFNQLHVLDLEQLRWSELWSEGSGGCLRAL